MSVIELLVVMSTITIVLAIGFPKIEDFAIRARVNEGLMMAKAARQALRESCVSSPEARIHNLDNTELDFKPTKYVSEVIVSANCAKGSLWVGVVTRNTGAHPDPYLAFSGVLSPTSRQFTWECQLVLGSPDHVPEECSVPTTQDHWVVTN